jgi:hypothetical protein
MGVIMLPFEMNDGGAAVICVERAVGDGVRT